MPSIIYGGVKYNQTRHALYCKKCCETIESAHVHDFKMCACGAVGVDGGISDSNRILGNNTDIETRSLYCAFVNNKRIWLPKEVIESQFTLTTLNQERYKDMVS